MSIYLKIINLRQYPVEYQWLLKQNMTSPDDPATGEPGMSEGRQGGPCYQKMLELTHSDLQGQRGWSMEVPQEQNPFTVMYGIDHKQETSEEDLTVTQNSEEGDLGPPVYNGGGGKEQTWDTVKASLTVQQTGCVQ